MLRLIPLQADGGLETLHSNLDLPLIYATSQLSLKDVTKCSFSNLTVNAEAVRPFQGEVGRNFTRRTSRQHALQ